MSLGLVELERGDRVADLRLLVPALTAWAACWWVTFVGLRLAWIACGVGILACVVGAALRARLVMMGAAALVAAAVSGGLHLAALVAGPLPAMAASHERVDVIVLVASDPVVHQAKAVGSQLRPDLVLMRVVVTELRSPTVVRGLHSPVLVLASGRTRDWLALLPSQRLELSGKLAPPRPGDELTAVLTARGPPTPIGRPTGVQRLAGEVRSGLRNAVAGQSADVRGLLPGLVLGDVSRMDSDLTDDFRTAGLTHLVAVSGANVR